MIEERIILQVLAEQRKDKALELIQVAHTATISP